MLLTNKELNVSRKLNASFKFIFIRILFFKKNSESQRNFTQLRINSFCCFSCSSSFKILLKTYFKFSMLLENQIRVSKCNKKCVISDK